MRRWLAGAAVVAVGFLASPGAVPVYDGVGAPDEPYRLVGTDPAPTDARADVEVSGGRSLDVKARTGESGPQALLDLAPGAFAATGPFTVTVAPLVADGALPAGTFDGAAYRIAVTGDAQLQPEQTQGFLFLRAAVMTSPAPVIVYRATPTDTWTPQQTSVSGQDILGTPFRKVGDYVVVRPAGAEAISAAGGLSTGRVLVLGGGVLLLLVVTVAVLRRPRTEDE